MRVLGIIPARGGSKRVPRKNLRLLGGKPLVARTIEAALSAKRLHRVIVSSEDEEILQIASNYSADLALRRPAELATDTSLAIDYVRHALEVLEGKSADRFDAIAIMQPSSPFTLGEDIDATIDLLDRTGADSAVSVRPIDFDLHPAKLKVLQGDRLLPYFEDEQGRMAYHELPPLYARNGSVYSSRRHVIDSGKILGADCRAYVMPRERSLDINDEIDLSFAEFLIDLGTKDK